MARNTKVKRGEISDAVRYALWARTAGRCTMCNNRLLGDSRTYYHSVLAAEMAHNIGATATAGSPRGLVENIEDRESEENLLLLCHDCHRVIDHKAHVHLYPPERLRALKAEHESRIERQTAVGGMTRTAALRVGSNIRGSFAMASRREVGDTLIAANHLPLVESQLHGHFRCEVTGDETDRSYWLGAQDAIDKMINNLDEAKTEESIEHVSVFAIAPIPVLVYLGSRLDDKTRTTIYQRSRDDEIGWRWPNSGTPRQFRYAMEPGDDSAVVFLVGLTAEIQPDRIPDNLKSSMRFTLTTDDGVTDKNLMTHEGTLANFARAWGDLLAEAERRAPKATAWHLIAATGVAPAVEMGRAFMRDAHPAVTVYQRTSDTYVPTIELNR